MGVTLPCSVQNAASPAAQPSPSQEAASTRLSHLDLNTHLTSSQPSWRRGSLGAIPGSTFFFNCRPREDSIPIVLLNLESPRNNGNGNTNRNSQPWSSTPHVDVGVGMWL